MRSSGARGSRRKERVRCAIYTRKSSEEGLDQEFNSLQAQREACGSVRLLKDELEAPGIKSKSWTTASGRRVGGKPFSRGALYLILQNRHYRGEIVHNGQSHPGEHAPIIDQSLWDAVQGQFAANTAERHSGVRPRQPSPLAGLLFDGDGNPMTSIHATKEGRRYRYYVSRRLSTNDQTERSAGRRIPAGEIEQAVTSRMRQWLVDPGSVYQTIRLADPSAQRRLIARAEEIGRSWPDLPAARQRNFLTALIERIDVGANRIDIQLRATRLGMLLDIAKTPLPSDTDGETQILSVPIALRRSGREIKMLIEGTDPFATAKPDARLIKLLIRARRFNATLVDGDGLPFAALAKQEGVSPSYFTRLVRFSYLAPDIIQAILDGRQPRDLTADKLLADSRLPLTWHEQQRVLGLLDRLSQDQLRSAKAATTLDYITGTAILEFSPAETLSPVGEMSPVHPSLCRPHPSHGPHTPAKMPGFSPAARYFP